MSIDPDTYPTAEDEWIDAEEEGTEPDAEEWQPGTCDNCSGPPATAAEREAVLASAITPVCACWIGQGAHPSACTCGPVSEPVGARAARM